MIYRNTVQRAMTLEAVRRLHAHPTAEEVYRQVAAEHPSVSRATVYRNLRQLEACSRLRRVAVPDGSDRYDGRLDPHEHMICETCGRAVDLCLGLEPGLLDQIRQKTGAAVSGCRLVIWGQCEACRRADKSASGSI